jgi:hypothetical protein
LAFVQHFFASRLAEGSFGFDNSTQAEVSDALWAKFTIPFALFQRCADWQPPGAPDDGLGLKEVSGYAFGFPVGVGAQTAYLDDFQLVTMDDVTDVLVKFPQQ